MSTAPFKNLILASMDEVLRPEGFRKTGAVFKRSMNDVIHLISLQSSTSSTAFVLCATVNLAVWVPGLSDGPNWQPDVWSSHWHKRIGHLMPEHANDYWWSVTTEKEAQAAGEEIKSAIQIRGLPALTALQTSSALAVLWESGSSPGLTKFQAKRYLGRLNERAKNQLKSQYTE